MSTTMIILAAGKSTRMKSTISKVMHPIAERPLISYILETANQSKVEKLILVTSPSMQEVRDFINLESPKTIHITQDKQLGTADAVKSALSSIDKTGFTLIMYGDTPFVSQESIIKMRKSTADLLLLGFNTEQPNKYGRLITEHESLLEIVEYNDATDEQKLITHCNSGIYYIKNELLHKLIPLINNDNAKQEFYLTDLVKLATSHNFSCKVMNVDEEETVGINTREDLSNAQDIMQRKIMTKLMNQGVTIIKPETSYISSDFIAGTDVTIYPNVFIGKNVSIGNNVNIRSFSHIEGAKIESHINIGPFARIRPFTKISNNARIGNFVEIKNSQVNSGSKIGHLSYIGDAEIGADTNIGAGAITCNFDGVKKKSKTNIGNKVSIGSNTSLVAPVSISDGAFIAAGSVITKDVEKDALAFGRSRQVNLSKKPKGLRDE